MKRFMSLFLTLSISLALIGCGDKKSDNKSAIRRSSRGPTELTTLNNGTLLPQPGSTTPGRAYSPANGKVWGAIYGNTTLADGTYLSESDFNWSIHAFVAATMNPDELGFVSASPNASTGIRFWGYVEPSTGVLNSLNMNTTVRAQNSELRIVIWDSYAGQVDSSGEVITEVPVHIKGTASGSITGNRAVIRFTQRYVGTDGREYTGWIELNGTFDSQYFQGLVWYDNPNGSAYYMGAFYIATCSFFRCN